jgi:tripartite-type tricarboxylate transporter receptor subunit TctC
MKIFAYLLVLFSFFVTSISVAQTSWPSKKITIVIPFPAGGPADRTIRTIQPDLEKEFGVPVAVLNIAGSGAAAAVAHILVRNNDNHTFLFTELEFVIAQAYANTHQYRKFTPLSTVLSTPFILYTNTSSRDSQLKFRAQIQTKNSVNVGYVGSSVAWLDQISTPMELNLIPYKGGAPLWADVMAGHVEYGISGAGGVWNKVYVDKVFRPIMISGDRRSAAYPGVPTATELGLQSPRVDLWFTFWTQKDTDARAQTQFVKGLRNVITKNTGIQDLPNQGWQILNLNQADTEKYISEQIRQYEQLAVTKKSK